MIGQFCLTRLHCVACRTQPRFRASVLRLGLVRVPDFDCPYGITAETAKAIQAEALKKLSGNDPEAAEKRKAELEVQGRAAWAWLHAEAQAGRLTEERITRDFEAMIPNYGCGCMAKWKMIRTPLTSDQRLWAWERHNDVNRELGKPLWPVDKAP